MNVGFLSMVDSRMDVAATIIALHDCYVYPTQVLYTCGFLLLLLLLLLLGTTAIPIPQSNYTYVGSHCYCCCLPQIVVAHMLAPIAAASVTLHGPLFPSCYTLMGSHCCCGYHHCFACLSCVC